MINQCLFIYIFNLFAFTYRSCIMLIRMCRRKNTVDKSVFLPFIMETKYSPKNNPNVFLVAQFWHSNPFWNLVLQLRYVPNTYFKLEYLVTFFGYLIRDFKTDRCHESWKWDASWCWKNLEELGKMYSNIEQWNSLRKI